MIFRLCFLILTCATAWSQDAQLFGCSIQLPPGPAAGGTLTIHFILGANTPDITIQTAVGDRHDDLIKKFIQAFTPGKTPAGKPAQGVTSLNFSIYDTQLWIAGIPLGHAGLISTDVGLPCPQKITNLQVKTAGDIVTASWTIPKGADYTDVDVVLNGGWQIGLPPCSTKYRMNLPYRIKPTVDVYLAKSGIPGEFTEVVGSTP